jgi:hypothetical protein
VVKKEMIILENNFNRDMCKLSSKISVKWKQQQEYSEEKNYGLRIYLRIGRVKKLVSQEALSSRRGLNNESDPSRSSKDVKISHVIHQLSERELYLKRQNSKGVEPESAMTFGLSFGGSKRLNMIPKRDNKRSKPSKFLNNF